jgi:hypothetical protein
MKSILTTLFISLFAFTAPAQDVNAIVEEITTEITLDQTQSDAMKSEMEKYAISLQLIFDKYEQGEPDPQAMLTDIKYAREDYQKKLKAAIGKEKFEAYEAYTDKVKLEILGEAAELRLIDLQEPLMMTDQQVQDLKPVMAKAMKGILETLMQYVDAKMNVRTKLKVGNSLKRIKKTMDAEMAEILTPEQIKKWEALREAAKEEEAKQEGQ